MKTSKEKGGFSKDNEDSEFKESPLFDGVVVDDIVEQSKYYVSGEKKIEDKKIAPEEKWLTTEDKLRLTNLEEELRQNVIDRGIEEDVIDELIHGLKTGNIDIIGKTVNYTEIESVTHNRELLRRILIIKDFNFAESLEEIIQEINKKGKIVESGRVYLGGELIAKIKQGKIEGLPSAYNLRQAVARLVNQDDFDQLSDRFGGVDQQ